MTLVLFVSSFLLMFNTSKADIYTPINVSLSVDEFNSVLNRYFENGFNLDDKLTELPKIKGLTATFSEVKYKANIKPRFELDEDSNIKISSFIDLAQFELFDLDLKYKTTRKVGSTKINIRTEIQCEYLKVYLVEDIKYEVSGILEKNKPKIISSYLPNNLDLRIESKNCVGPKDFEVFLPEILLKWLITDDGEKETLSFLNNEVIDTFWTDLKKGIEVDFFGRPLFFALLNFQQINGDFKVNLMVRWPKEDKFYLNLADPKVMGQFNIGAKDFEYIVKNWMSTGCFSFTFERKDISGVDKLFNNRFYQFFVWPDLANFNKNANFNLKLKVCFENIVSTINADKTLNLAHQSSVFIQMNFIGSQNKELPYIYLWSKAAGNIKLFTNEKGLAFSLINNKFDFKYMNHPKMSEWRKSKPTGGPAIKTIMGFILPELEKLQTTILPNFKEVFENKKIQINSDNLYFQ